MVCQLQKVQNSFKFSFRFVSLCDSSLPNLLTVGSLRKKQSNTGSSNDTTLNTYSGITLTYLNLKWRRPRIY
jgi:hypothetical protein